MNKPDEIGDYLKQLRTMRGLTQANVAAIIGIQTATYTQFETGKTNMTLKTLNRIADALGYDLQVSFNVKRPTKAN